jgi:hypothetical protein
LLRNPIRVGQGPIWTVEPYDDDDDDYDREKTFLVDQNIWRQMEALMIK